ncbi:MAG: YdeI/OmpD-associated family protein [Aeromicrobium sp.]
MHTGGTPERPATFFADADEFRAWLAANHDTATELWMGLHKKHVDQRGLTWEQAVPEALCFGWIDSRVERIDEDAVRQRWTPRRTSSVWSRVNIDLVARLTAEGRMQPSGLAAFERRKPERSGIYFYENSDPDLPDEYARLIDAEPRAARFWAAATPSYRKHAKSWVLSAKQQATRDRRMAELVENCAAGRLIKTQRYGDEPKWVARLRAELGEVS